MKVSNQSLNFLRVLKTIRRHGPISRSELPNLTGLAGSTITQITGDLVGRGLVNEISRLDRRQGRPRTDLEINASGAVVVGVSIVGAGHFAARFVDLVGTLHYTYKAVLRPANTLEEFVIAIAERVEEAITASPFKVSELARVGIGVPGLTDSSSGTLHSITTLSGQPVQAAQIISERVRVPVTIENDETRMARAIHWFGEEDYLDAFTLVRIGAGVTTAVYANGLPASGLNGLNASIGHVRTAFGEGARPCFCGAKGCLTAYSSIYGMLREANMLEGLSVTSLKQMELRFADLLSQSEAGDIEANALFDTAADHLGVAVANYLTSTNPSHLVIAMPSDRLHRRIEGRFNSALRENVLPAVLAATQIRCIITAPSWRQSGIAALALEQAYIELRKRT